MYEFIPIAERKKFRCKCCGSNKSVKYLVKSVDGKKVPYCNKCALKYSLGMIEAVSGHDTGAQAKEMIRRWKKS